MTQPQTSIPPTSLEQRDHLAQSLRTGFRAILLEADEWRPLADHITNLIAAAAALKQEACAQIVDTAAEENYGEACIELIAAADLIRASQ